MSNIQSIVTQGDCVYSLAARHGHVWQTLWNHSDNEHLRKNQRAANQLAPGDLLVIPEIRPDQIDGESEQRHRFRKKGSLVEIRIVVSDLGMPRKNEPYYLEGDSPVHRIDGVTKKTDANGLAVIKVPSALQRATLVVGDKKDRYELLIGHMDPLDTDTGKHSRLENLGYFCGDLAMWDEFSEDAMNEFHRAEGFPESAERDTDADPKRLKDGYGS
jgi:hypothetical protein